MRHKKRLGQRLFRREKPFELLDPVLRHDNRRRGRLAELIASHDLSVGRFGVGFSYRF